MVFILSTDSEIVGNIDNLGARLKFIFDITDHTPDGWKKIKLCNNMHSFYICRTEDRIEGMYITAHNYEVMELCKTDIIKNLDFIAANTCIYQNELDTDMLRVLWRRNKNILLYYAKQQMEMMSNFLIRNTNTLRDVGTFGFMTTRSDRLLYKNRKKGFEEALKSSFNIVSGLYGV